MAKHLFDENPDVNVLRAPHYEHFFAVIKSSLYESFVQGITRLHDKAVILGNENLTINYVIERIEWDAATNAKLNELRQKMTPFADKLRPARHKFMAHNDLNTILQRPLLGVFEKGEDDAYFVALEGFVSTALGDQFLFGNFVPTDVALFMAAFERGRIKPEH